MNKLKENIFILFVIQIANYIIPILTFPLLIAKLQVQNFGIYSFVFAILTYFISITEYGFTLDATKKTTLIQNDASKLRQIFIDITACKVILLVLSFIILLFCIFLIPDLSKIKFYFLIGYLFVVGTALTPIWFFLGIENLRPLAVISFISKLLFLASIFIFVKSSEDLKVSIILNSISSLSVGIAATVFLSLKLNLFKTRITIDTKDLMQHFKDSWPLFISNIGISFYSNTNTVILGFTSNISEVSKFVSAEKIVRAIQTLLSSINQALFPHISKLLNINNESGKVKKELINLYLYQILFLIFSIVFLFFTSKIFIPLFYQKIQTDEILILFRLLLLVILLGGISIILGNQLLIPKGFYKEFSRMILFAGTLNVLFLFLLTKKHGAYGASISVILTEFCLVCLMSTFIWFKKEQIF